MNVNSGFCLRQPEVRAPRDPAESTGMCGDSFSGVFLGVEDAVIES